MANQVEQVAVAAAEDGRVNIANGRWRASVEQSALTLKRVRGGVEVRVRGERHRGVLAVVEAAVGDQLAAIGVEWVDATRPAARSAERWVRREFEVDIKVRGGAEGEYLRRRVLGLAWGGFGVPEYYVADDGAATVDDYDRPTRTLTHLATARAAWSPGKWREGKRVAVPRLKRLAEAIVEAAPALAAAADLSAVPPEQRAAYRAIVADFDGGVS